MAFQTGTNVDPRLMMADYSGFAKAAEIEAQGMQNLAAGLTDGIKKFAKKKEDDKKIKLGVDYTMGFIKQEPNLARSLGIEFEDSEGFYDEDIARKSANDYVKISGIDKLTENILSMQALAQKSRSNATKLNLAQREEYFDPVATDRLGALALTLGNEIEGNQILHDTNPGVGKTLVNIKDLPQDHVMYQTFFGKPGSGPFGLIPEINSVVPGIQSGGVIKYRPNIEEIPTLEPTESLIDTSGFSVATD